MSAQCQLHVDWEAHLEALPLPTWILRIDQQPSSSQNQDILSGCGPVFLNQACRQALGLTTELANDGAWSRYLHPEDRPACLVAWSAFLSGQTAQFHQKLRWIRPDSKDTQTLAVRAQKLLCGDIQGWLRSAAAEEALSRLEELAYARR